MDFADAAPRDFADAALRDFARLASTRRTALPADPDRELPATALQVLVGLLSTAPNHHKTSPWRACAVRGHGRRRLGEAFAADLVAGGRAPDDPKVTAVARKYLRAPVVVVIGCESAADADDTRRREDRDAVAAGVQTLLLGATAAGMSSFWASPPCTDGAATRELCGFSTSTEIAAVIYLGTDEADRVAIDKPPPPTRWVE